ncbi:P-loop containing nucleoside triphosphate hydrolase protein [Cerioporus squamosus]|nr:P-loop containing nucleoside triphosphate hydrolase protein [Cerioporus squamosus]
MPDSVSREELEQELKDKCHLSSIRPFQLNCGLSLVKGSDLFLVVAPGMGKTAVMAAPFLMAQSRKERGIGLVIVPTKILTEQQTFASYGLRALAINEDTLRRARYSNRDLLSEIAAGEDVCIAVVTPWMLKNDKLQAIISSKIRPAIRWFLMDEIHLANRNDPTVWLEAYQAAVFMRSRLSSRTTWAGFTGTATLAETRAISRDLGFRPGYFVDARYTLDRHNVKFIPRFLEHSVSGYRFLDLSFLIPRSISSAAEIPSTLIFCETIELGYRIGLDMDSRLPQDLEGRDLVVMPCNRLMDVEYREKFKARMEQGITRISIVTDTCTYGLNVHATRVVILLSGDLGGYSRLVQQAGRVSRDGSEGLVYVLAPSWTRNIPAAEIKTKTQKEEQARRARSPKVIIDLLNATPALCPRQLHCAYNDEPFERPHPCCSLHDLEPEASADDALNLAWRVHFEAIAPPQMCVPRSDGTHLAPNKTMKASVVRLLTHWHEQQWRVLCPPSHDEPPCAFLPTYLITLLSEKIHVCTTPERFREVIGRWDYLEECGEVLYDYLQDMLVEYDKMYIDKPVDHDEICEIDPPPVSLMLLVCVLSIDHN